jgi:signal transduction histidine kinase/integral membrane sensor domain MASE1
MGQMIKRYCISIGITALLYFGVAKLVLSNLQLGIEPSPLWPPAGIAMFILLQQGRQVWLGVALGILLVGQWLGVAWTLVAGSAIGGALEAVLGTTLLRQVGFRPSMARLQDVLNFIVFAGLTAPVLNASINTGVGLSLHQLSKQQAGQTWWTFWLGDCMGILVFTPLLLTLDQQRPRLQRYLQRRTFKLSTLLQTPRLIEQILCFSLLIGLSWAIFHFHPNSVVVNYPIEYLPFPFVIWAALRLGQTSGIVASFLLSLIAVSGTVAGKGPFVTMTNGIPASDAPRQVILLLQAFLGVITMTVLILVGLTSERQRVEALLRRSQNSLAKAQELARLGNWDYDFEQRHWSWSDELYRLLGFPVRGIAPSQAAFLQAVHPDDRAQVEQALEQAIVYKTAYRINYRLLLPDGTERIVEEQVAVNPTNATGTVLDVTEHKQNEENLRLNAERNRLLSEMALRIRRSLDLNEILNTTVQEVRQLLQADRVLICRFDAAGRGKVVAESVLAGWNSALNLTSDASVYPEIQAAYAERQVCAVNDVSTLEATEFIRQYHQQYQVKAGIGVPITFDPAAIYPDNTQNCCLATDSDQLAAEYPRLFGLLIVHQCSRTRQWQPAEIDLLEQLATQVTIAIQQGRLYQQVQHLNCNLENQVVERTLQLQVNLAKLEEMNELQDVFLHAIAHDLRTTVMGTLMILKNFQQHPGDEIPISRSMLERMTQSGEIQLCKLNSLLEAYTNKTEGLVLRQEPINIQLLLNNVVAKLKPLFEQNHADVTLSIDDLPPVMGDPVQLERVFSHLLVNAVKHNPPGVQVSVRTQLEPNGLRFIIEDNGRGVSTTHPDRLFDLKITGGQDRQRTGIGVGLCLCQQIVSAHGGEIGVESELDKGSQFWFTLPLVEK